MTHKAAEVLLSSVGQSDVLHELNLSGLSTFRALSMLNFYPHEICCPFFQEPIWMITRPST